MSLLELLTKSLLFSLIAAVLWSVAFVVQRLVFHPLAKYPGPKLAALTSFYEDYFEVYGEANYDYIWQIKKLHQKYGPIIRINPHEIHIDDPAFYPVLNSFKGKWDKDPHTAAQFANPTASVGTVDHDLHKRRKAAIQPFFAKQKIYELEPVVIAKALQLCARLHDYRVNGQVAPLRQAFKCYCVDTIAEYCFAKSGNMIDQPDFAIEHWRQMAKGLDAGARMRYLPKWMLAPSKIAPSWIRESIMPGLSNFGTWHDEKDINSSVDFVHAKAGEAAEKVSSHRTIFHELYSSPYLAPEDKNRTRLVQEGAALIGAGGETTSQIIGNIIFGLLENKEKMQRLRTELRSMPLPAGSEIPSLRQLESNQYMTGCVKEGLRLRTGKIGRQQRVPVGQAITYKQYTIEPGTICSMTPAFSHIHPAAFPDPHSFKPERWVGVSDAERSRMESYFVAYSKGTRMCTGMSLANAMIYIGVAAIALDLDLTLYETTVWDNEWAVDTEKHSPLKGSEGLRAKVANSQLLQTKV